MNHYMLTVTLAALLPTGVSGQDEVAARVRRTVEMLELVELAKTDREAAMLVFSGARQAAARIVEDPGNWRTLPDELDMYFDYSRDIIAGEFGPVTDATRDLIAEAFVLVAIEDADRWRWYDRVADAGEAGFERVDQALFQIYTALRERNPRRASIVINGYAGRPPERALPYLSRLVAQQDDDVAAMTAIEIMARAGEEGADAIMALERAGTVNELGLARHPLGHAWNERGLSACARFHALRTQRHPWKPCRNHADQLPRLAPDPWSLPARVIRGDGAKPV
ncbi:MAG: hypothetical protein OXN92_01945 [Gammaproteobacteria bacterium]|nr:hypothetical protein [Gammaproteobacteria bacterium]